MKSKKLKDIEIGDNVYIVRLDYNGRSFAVVPQKVVNIEKETENYIDWRTNKPTSHIKTYFKVQDVDGSKCHTYCEVNLDTEETTPPGPGMHATRDGANKELRNRVGKLENEISDEINRLIEKKANLRYCLNFL